MSPKGNFKTRTDEPSKLDMKRANKFSIVVSVLLACSPTEAQHGYDNNWLFGYAPNNPEEGFGGTKLSFSDNDVDVQYFHLPPTTLDQRSILSKQTAELILYSEGCRIYNQHHEVIHNGNMTYDPSKGVTFTYNHLNLPMLADFGSSKTIEWLYDATGTLLRKTVKDGVTTLDKRDYVGAFEYVNDYLESVYHSNGRIFNGLS